MSAKRFSDQHAGNFLELSLGKDDCDIVITAQGFNVFVGRYETVSIVFTSPDNGGGRSPRTYAALQALMQAMLEDEQNSPQRRRS